METLESAPTDPATLLRGSRGPLDQIQHVLHRYPVISPTFVLLASCVVFTMLGDASIATTHPSGPTILDASRL